MKRFCIFAFALLSVLAVSAQQLHILHTSDMHSRIEPFPVDAATESAGMGGIVRRATFLKQYRSEHKEPVLLFDSGDISQGTPYYNMFRGELEIKAMNLMKYDAMTIGNHEFDFGLDNMARIFRMAEFPIVCANLDVRGTVLEGLVKPYVVLQRAGVKIGVFGLATKLDGLVQADKCEGVLYLDPVETANKVAETLKVKEECDVVICLSHLGSKVRNSISDDNLLPHLKNVDVLLGGHSHTYMKNPQSVTDAEGENVYVLHSGANGSYVGQMLITLKKE